MTTANMHSPMMKQWDACKQKAKEALLLFRLGDFYEAFYDDASLIAKELELTLTKRQNIPMCGVPFHASESYIDKLLVKGYKVAIAEQLEDPSQTKGIVKRDIVKILSKGSLLHSSLLNEKQNNYFVAITEVGKIYGLAYLDLSTGEFNTLEIEEFSHLIDELLRLKPVEILLSKKFLEKYSELIENLTSYIRVMINSKDEWLFDHHLATDTLLKHFHLQTLDSFGLKGMVASINACGALISYLKDEMLTDLSHIQSIKTDQLSEYMALDYACLRHLEILDPLHQEKGQSLLSLLDHTHTPMGGRLFCSWIKHPLIQVEKICERQKALQEFLDNYEIYDELPLHLKSVRDIQRLIMKISNKIATPKDVVALKQSLKTVPLIKALLKNTSSQILQSIYQDIADITSCWELIDLAIQENPPLRIGEGACFKAGYHPQLDELNAMSKDSKSWIANYQNVLQKQTNIKTLRVGFTRVFGYYIEVSKGQAKNMPNTFHRRQTLANSERFTTEELKTFEHKILSADEKIKALETQLFNQLLDKLQEHQNKLLVTSKAIALADCILSLAIAAKKYRFNKPTIDDSNRLEILEGRHPIIETTLPFNKFIANDTLMDDERRLFLITGPNMAGKSTFIRQVALIVIMAQIGSFVPAQKAHVGIVDKVFSRIGASDDLSRGQSTFMVEMCETANILHNCTDKSLIILDEIGRGTSTYDGISIAWAVAEYLLTTKNKKAKTLFATHYWELTDMEKKIPGAVNYNVAVKETNEGIVFLHKILPGGTDKSYGIHVAKLAKLPANVIHKAEKMLALLESNAQKKPKKIKTISSQYYLFNPYDPLNPPSLAKQELSEKDNLVQEIKNLDINNMTPIEAQKILSDLQKKILYEL